MIQKMALLREKVRQNKPLIHCITNPISINDCANVILSLGGAPIMAEHPCEVCEIVKNADALCLNLGNITDARMESMILAGKTANQCNIPIILDLVGVGCSTFRLDYAKKLLNDINPTVVKGNFSEIKAMFYEKSACIGVDVSENDVVYESTIKESAEVMKKIAAEKSFAVIATGKIDMVSKNDKCYCIFNGTPKMSRLTGTGCMANVCVGTFLSFGDSLTASVLGLLIMSIAGERADHGDGKMGSFHVSLLDEISTICDEEILKRMKIKKY